MKLIGVRLAVDFNLNLLYSAGSLGTFGLPNNWELDLPYVCRGKSLTVKGRTYALDLNWSDSTPAPALGVEGLQNPDGSSDYLDQAGKPRERHDMYGNNLDLSYANDLEGGVDSPKLWLRSIEDSWDQQITFGHLVGSGLSIKS